MRLCSIRIFVAAARFCLFPTHVPTLSDHERGPVGLARRDDVVLYILGHDHPAMGAAIERQLGHAETDDVRRAYARGEHWDERIRMMQNWGDYLDQLRSGAKVLQGSFRKPVGTSSAIPG